MAITSNPTAVRAKYHQNAYQFLFAALRFTQEQLGRDTSGGDEESAHISGTELVEGVRDFALQQFGLMTIPVFHQWGIRCTEDFGRIVFELVEKGEMRKTERDSIHDFCEVYDFVEAFDLDYEIDTSAVFEN